MKGFGRANFLATLATDTFSGIKILNRVEVERTNIFTTPAINAPILREFYLRETVLVEQTVNRAERTHYAAKKSVDKNAPDNHGDKDRNFQREQIA